MLEIHSDAGGRYKFRIFNVSTGQYTCPVSGFYRCSAGVAVSATYALNSSSSIGIGHNSTTVNTFSSVAISGGAETLLAPTVSGTIYCNAGDTLNPTVTSSATATISASAPNNFFYVELLSGPQSSQQAASVNASYTATGTQSVSNNSGNGADNYDGQKLRQP